jgi:membrane dipeptidase
MKLLCDIHLDLSMNALEWNRDLTLPIDRIRENESGRQDMKGRGQNTVCFDEMRRGGIGLCVATQIGGCMKPRGPVACWESPAQAWAMTQGQLAYYKEMTDIGQMRPITDLASLDAHLADWSDPVAAAAKHRPIGYILSLEGADSMVTLDHLERAYASGLRALGPAHYGRGRYALGHDQVGGLLEQGPALLRKMDELGIILDTTHLSDACFFEALEIYSGPIWASHSNCRALVPDPRQYSDEQIRLLIERGAVIGGVLDAWMLVPGWERGISTPASTGVKLSHLVDHIDHICQLAGNTRHIAIGSDLDGGFGREQGPLDLDTIADLQTLDELLQSRGYTDEDVTGIFHGNFLRLLRSAWS